MRERSRRTKQLVHAVNAARIRSLLVPLLCFRKVIRNTSPGLVREAKIYAGRVVALLRSLPPPSHSLDIVLCVSSSESVPTNALL